MRASERNFTALAVAAAVGAGSSSAQASGFLTGRMGGEHGHPTTENPTALYYNPAALGFSDGTHVFVEGTFGVQRRSYEHSLGPGDTDVPAGANTGKAELMNAFAAPALGFSMALGGLRLGASLFVPFGGAGIWKQNDAFANDPVNPGPVDGVARWSSIAGKLSTVYYTAGAAYRFGMFSLGLSGNLIQSKVETVQAATATGGNDVSLEGRTLLQVKGTHGSFAVGVGAELLDDTLWVGASYQAQPGLGEMRLRGSQHSNLHGAIQDDPDVDLVQSLPDVVRFGVRFRPIDRLELRLSQEFVRWSVLTHQCIVAHGNPCSIEPDGSTTSGQPSVIRNMPRDWQNAIAVHAGVSYWPSKPLELFGGVTYDSSAVPDASLDPALPDADDFTVGLGARYKVAGPLFVAGSYSHLQALPRDTTGKSTHFTGYEKPSRSPDTGGTYKLSAEIFVVNVELVF